MKDRKSFSLVDLVSIVVIIGVLAAILVPVMTHMRVTQANKCQSNLSRIGIALAMYCNDWDGKYPTQRLQFPMNTFIAPNIMLSDPNKIGPDGQPIIFQIGINWVEALYCYIGERAAAGSTPSVWKCPSAKMTAMGGSTAGVTYSFNANLIETNSSAVRQKNTTMMCRELDWLYNSVLRPAIMTLSDAPAPPNPFLNSYEFGTNPKVRMHDEGSHILMTDGHVKYFPAAYYPQNCQWSSSDRQWYNYVDGVQNGDPRKKSIALIP